VLTAYDDDEYIFAFLEAGAAGYMLKDASTQDLVKGIRAVHAGESVLHPVVARKVIDHFGRRTEKQRTDQQQQGTPAELTERELEVLKLAAKGMTNREIAAALVISPRTVQAHMSNIFGRLKVGSRTEAILCALRESWISMEDMA
jgi:NarL family two-component system response regulator LiaR